jgi:hemerythrin-like metal-binding protein
MDDDHKELAAVIDGLLATRGNGYDSESASQKAARLIVAARRHFEREELWMAQTGDPSLADHTDEHTRLLEDLLLFKTLLESDDSFSIRHMHDFMREWLRDHICNTDMPLAAHLGDSAPSRLSGFVPTAPALPQHHYSLRTTVLR